MIKIPKILKRFVQKIKGFRGDDNAENVSATFATVAAALILAGITEITPDQQRRMVELDRHIATAMGLSSLVHDELVMGAYGKAYTNKTSGNIADDWPLTATDAIALEIDQVDVLGDLLGFKVQSGAIVEDYSGGKGIVTLGTLIGKSLVGTVTDASQFNVTFDPGNAYATDASAVKIIRGTTTSDGTGNFIDGTSYRTMRYQVNLVAGNRGFTVDDQILMSEQFVKDGGVAEKFNIKRNSYYVPPAEKPDSSSKLDSEAQYMVYIRGFHPASGVQNDAYGSFYEDTPLSGKFGTPASLTIGTEIQAIGMGPDGIALEGGAFVDKMIIDENTNRLYRQHARAPMVETLFVDFGTKDNNDGCHLGNYNHDSSAETGSCSHDTRGDDV